MTTKEPVKDCWICKHHTELVFSGKLYCVKFNLWNPKQERANREKCFEKES